MSIYEHRPVAEIAVQAGRADGVIFEDGARAEADIVVLAAGAWSRGIEGLPPDRRPPVRPVKGQMLALRMDPASPLLNHVLWAPGAYLVPRRDGRMIIGGTVEEKGFDETITAGGMLTLLEAAWRAIARHRGTADRRNLGRPPARQPGRRPDPRPRAARKSVLCDRSSPQRHIARAGDRGCDGKTHSRRCLQAGAKTVCARALPAGACRGVGDADERSHNPG